ncbi:MAG: tRNA (N6-threonylcarbamoyladenosine(37)-N6)-methyltransferase TrmO [Candidatus Thorarchaeota archaeon]
MNNLQETFTISPIGFVRKNNDKTVLEIKEDYKSGLLQLEKFSHLIVLWWITGRDNPTDRRQLVVKPCVEGSRDGVPNTGVFACRAPLRPNPLGLSIVRILDVQENIVFIERIDAFDDTPIIDLKPYLPKSDCIINATVPDFMIKLAAPREN